ncbi:DUF1127 domain-containing protein [Roseomonas sp. GCM10028921]
MSGHVIPSGSSAWEILVARRLRAGVQHASGWLRTLACMMRAVEERRILATLDDRMLADVGLNRLAAEREATRAPWDLERRN